MSDATKPQPDTNSRAVAAHKQRAQKERDKEISAVKQLVQEVLLALKKNNYPEARLYTYYAEEQRRFFKKKRTEYQCLAWELPDPFFLTNSTFWFTSEAEFVRGIRPYTVKQVISYESMSITDMQSRSSRLRVLLEHLHLTQPNNGQIGQPSRLKHMQQRLMGKNS